MPIDTVVYQLLLNPNKDELVGDTSEGYFTIWHLETFKIKHKFNNHTYAIY